MVANQGSVRIGTAERKDIWIDETKNAQLMPGPGGYLEDTSTLSKKGATIGVKREEKITMNPGPGEYDQDASRIVMAGTGSVRIGTAERKDIW